MMFPLTLHRLQKWNSSFSAACQQLIASSESVNSVLNGASTCVTCADWACESGCCLRSTPPFHTRLTCPASSFFSHDSFRSSRNCKRMIGREEKEEGEVWSQCWEWIMPVFPGSHEWGAAFSHTSYILCHAQKTNLYYWILYPRCNEHKIFKTFSKSQPNHSWIKHTELWEFTFFKSCITSSLQIAGQTSYNIDLM